MVGVGQAAYAPRLTEDSTPRRQAGARMWLHGPRFPDRGDCASTRNPNRVQGVGEFAIYCSGGGYCSAFRSPIAPFDQNATEQE
jgi:hypothetical protein